MPKCVFRTDLRQQPVSEPLACIEVSEMFNRPAAPTVEECVHMLLADDEICLGSSEKRKIMQGPKVVGYIRIVDECLHHVLQGAGDDFAQK
jgi:hypothetical protein